MKEGKRKKGIFTEVSRHGVTARCIAWDDGKRKAFVKSDASIWCSGIFVGNFCRFDLGEIWS